MASANFDALHLRLSRKIDDPVAAAATDGSEVTQALRTDLLNRANRVIQNRVLTMAAGDWTQRRDVVMRYIPGLVTTQSITWASGSATLASDFSYWVECRDSTAGLMTYHPSKAELDGNLNSNIDAAFAILGTSIYGYDNGSAIGNGATGTLYYVKTDARASNGDTNDITIDGIWFDMVVDIAALLYHEEKGDFDRAAGLAQTIDHKFASMRF
jgi:hypothetical protein